MPLSNRSLIEELVFAVPMSPFPEFSNSFFFKRFPTKVKCWWGSGSCHEMYTTLSVLCAGKPPTFLREKFHTHSSSICYRAVINHLYLPLLRHFNWIVFEYLNTKTFPQKKRPLFWEWDPKPHQRNYHQLLWESTSQNVFMINNLILSDFVRGDFWRRKIFGKPRADFHMRYFTNVFPLMRNVIKHDNYLRKNLANNLTPFSF